MDDAVPIDNFVVLSDSQDYTSGKRKKYTMAELRPDIQTYPSPRNCTSEELLQFAFSLHEELGEISKIMSEMEQHRKTVVLKMIEFFGEIRAQHLDTSELESMMFPPESPDMTLVQ